MEAERSPDPLPCSTASPLQPPPASCWSSVVQKKPAPVPPISSRIFADCKTSKGIAVAVVDASAIIHGDKLAGCADKFVSVKEVLEEVRDPVSRQRLVFLPLSVETMDPSPEAIKKVVKFARETGDLQTLSDVDIKLIALTYMLDAQIHGTNHLRDRPPPLHVVNKKYLPEAQMPGWGDNVPNLAEWKALDKNSEEGFNVNSRILPLKDLNGTVIPTSEVPAEHTERLDEHHSVVRTRKNNFPKREIKLDGKKMVADGVDASKGEHTDDVDDWQPAVSRSTHRRYMKRKARCEARLAAEASEQPVEEIGVTSTNNNDGPNSGDGQDSADFSNHEVVEGVHFEHESPENDEKEESDYDGKNISSMFEKLTFNVDKFDVREQENTLGISNMEFKHDQSSNEEDDFDDVCLCLEDDKDICERNSDNLDVSSNGDGSFVKSFIDDSCSEQSGMLRSLSDSTVACITSDYAMQNVILQIGLRVLAPGGMQIRKMHRWVLRCHACNNVTQEVGKIFCPKCGNGGTLRKVSVTVDENGILLASRRQRIILRGTKYSIPLPQGGRDAITKNLILREDQLPRKLLYPKIKKKPNNKDDEFLCSDDIFSSVSEKRAPLKPPVGRTIALFSGKRNPNDNYFSRKH